MAARRVAEKDEVEADGRLLVEKVAAARGATELSVVGFTATLPRMRD